MTRFTRPRLALLAMLLAGTAVRLFRLGAQSLWYDETVSTYLAGSPLPELVRHTSLDIHPPGYYILLRGWLLLTGYGDGRADPTGFGLEWSSAFLSLFFGVLLIALVYALARRLTGERAALVAAALVALSPFNVWYSQEVRMYTAGAVLGMVAVWGMMGVLGTLGPRRQEEERRHGPSAEGARSTRSEHAPSRPSRFAPSVSFTSSWSKHPHQSKPSQWSKYSRWTKLLTYTLSAALGLYTLYYFAFLLIPLNLWALWHAARTGRVRAWLLTNAGVVLLYAPWAPTAWRQATEPPVPPWRTEPDMVAAVVETWRALVLGQSAPGWLLPVLVLAVGVYGVGLWAVARRSRSAAALLFLATFGPLALILGVSLVTPLYHVRYLFTYSPAFYIVLAASLAAMARKWRVLGVVIAAIWTVSAVLTLRQYWIHANFQPDDHRAAVHDLQEAWRPGDVVLVNAGWAYTALATYWDGDIAGRYRITGALPKPRDDTALVMVTTGHVDGDAALGWGDPRSDFFAMPSSAARQGVAELFDRFPRVWHYRIYDTVNDPGRLVRELLSANGRLLHDRVYMGEAFTRLEAYAGLDLAWPAELPAIQCGELELAWRPIEGVVEAGETVYGEAWWRAVEPSTTLLATSLRLIAAGEETWAQPRDENPFSPMHTSVEWQAGDVQRQAWALAVPLGTIPGDYDLVLVPYEAGTGQPLQATGTANGGTTARGSGVLLGRVTVERPVTPPPPQGALAQFGPLALVSAGSAATALSPGDTLAVDLLWQAREVPHEPYVVVVQLLHAQGAVAASAESQPVGGRYPTTVWAAGELVRDLHALGLPGDILPGGYSLIAGLYRAGDGQRLATRTGLMTTSDHWKIKDIVVR